MSVNVCFDNKLIFENKIDLEFVLNTCGYVPFISSTSGAFRVLVGQIECVFHGIIGTMFYLENPEGGRCFYHASRIFNGMGNIVRGNIETIPFAGNFICFWYDALKLMGRHSSL